MQTIMSRIVAKQKVHVLEPNMNISSFIQSVAVNSDQEKSFFVFDLGEIVKRHSEWKNALPRVTPFFVKCNDDSTVLKTMSALGCGFDCSSKVEIDEVLSLGVTTDRIIFAHTTKLVSYIQHAAKNNVDLMTFDNEQELYKIKKYSPNSRLVLRFRCDDESATAVLGVKFGCAPETEAAELLELARDLELNVVGAAFHVGSYSRNPEIFNLALRYARNIFNIAANLGHTFNILDIGGGYPGIKEATIDAFAKVINEGLNEYFSDPELTIIAEPGSFLVCTSGTLATNIHSLRTIKDADDSGRIYSHNMYYINDGYYGSFNNLLTHGCELFIEPLNENGNTELIKSTIWGPTCDNKDKIWEGMLPDMKLGEWILFHDAGDYTFRVASEFNGFRKPDIYFVVNEAIWKYLKNKLPFAADDFSGNITCDNQN